MNKELTEILCRILNINEDEFLNSYLNDDERTMTAIEQILQKHTIEGKKLLEKVAATLSKETGFKWKVKTKPLPDVKGTNEQIWLECETIGESMYYYDINIQDSDIPITLFTQISSTNPATKNITMESCLSLIAEDKGEIIKELSELTKAQRKSILFRIENLESKIVSLSQERAKTLQEQKDDEEKTTEFIKQAQDNRKKLQNIINTKADGNITIKDVLRITSKLNPADEIINYGQLLAAYNENMNKDYEETYTYTYEFAGIKGTVIKKLPAEVSQLIRFYNEKFGSRKNTLKYLKYIISSKGYTDFKETVQELTQLVKEAGSAEIDYLTIKPEEIKDSMRADFIIKANDLSKREELETIMPSLKKYSNRPLTLKEALLEFDAFWHESKENNDYLPDNRLSKAITGYINYMKKFAEKSTEVATYIDLYRKAIIIDKDAIDNYKSSSSLIEYKKNCLRKNTGHRTNKVATITKQIANAKQEIDECKEYLARMSIEEKELLTASTKQDNNTSQSDKTLIKADPNKDQK